MTELLIALIVATVLMLVGLALNLVGAPGSVLIWLAALGFSWYTGWSLAWWHLLVLFLLAALAEALARPDEAKRRGRELQARVRAQFDLRGTAAGFVAAYDRLLGLT